MAIILNRQRQIRIPVRVLERFLGRLQRRLGLPSDCFTVALVTNSQIARWNFAYRGKLRPTDVLSFASGIQQRRISSSRKAPERRNLFSSASYLGDLAIAPAVARRNARRFSRPFTQEMQILLLHGILHLLGYDHERDSGQMDRFEQRLRRELGLV
jgi:probable rRNA maturation factor